MTDALDLLDLTSEETLAALDEWHWDTHLIHMVEELGAGLGLAWYFIAPLGAAIFPVVFHYLYRASYFSGLTTATTGGWYEIAWQVLYWGNLGINGLIWIFEFIATFGVITEVNLYIWAIFYQGLGTLHFMAVNALFLVAINDYNTNTEPTNVELVQRDMAMYIGIYAWEKVMYTQYFPSWYTGMQLPKYKKLMKEYAAEEEETV